MCLILLCGLCNLTELLVSRPRGTGGAGKEWQLPVEPQTLSYGHSAAIWHGQSVRDVLLQKCPDLQTTSGPASLSGNIMFESYPSSESSVAVLKVILEDVLWHFHSPNMHKEEEKLGLTAKISGMLKTSVNDFHLAILFDECWKAVELRPITLHKIFGGMKVNWSERILES